MSSPRPAPIGRNAPIPTPRRRPTPTPETGRMTADPPEPRSEAANPADSTEPAGKTAVPGARAEKGAAAPPEASQKVTGCVDRIDPDLALVKKAAEGDHAAFEELVHRHQDKVYTRIFFMVRHRDTAADLCQEAFLRAWKGMASFRGESLFTTWLSRVATNVTRHHFERIGAQKRSAREVSIHASGDGEDRGIEIPDSRQLPEEWAIRNERQRRIVEAVAELEPEFRDALALRELGGYSYQEIGEELDLPIGTVKSKIFRARQQLQEKLKDLL